MRDRHDDLSAMPVAMRALASIMLGDGSRTAVLSRTCDATKALISGADEVSVTVLEAEPRTVASSGEMALHADQAQYRLDEGPCLDAARGGRPVLVKDLPTESRWPAYGPEALEAGVRASLSVPLGVGETAAGALNIYARRVDAFDEDVVDVAFDLAHYASIVVAAADERDRALQLAEQMQAAMESRAVIEQAKGILMRDRGCNAEEAFAALVRRSQAAHLKLREVAQQLVDEAAGSPQT